MSVHGVYANALPVLMRHDSQTGAWFIYLRREGPAGSAPLRLSRRLTVHVDIMNPPVPLLATVFAKGPEGFDDGDLELIELLFGSPTRHTLTQMVDERSMPYEPPDSARRGTTVNLLRLAADLTDRNPIADIYATALADDLGAALAGFRRTHALKTAAFLRCLDLAGLQPTLDEDLVLTWVATLCRVAAPDAPLGRFIRGDVTPPDAGMSTRLLPPLFEMPSEPVSLQLALRGRGSAVTSRQHANITFDIPADSGIRPDVISLTSTGTAGAVWAQIRVRFDSHPIDGDLWLTVVEDDSSVCTFEARIGHVVQKQGRWIWEARVLLAAPDSAHTIRIAPEPYGTTEDVAHAKRGRELGRRGAQMWEQMRTDPSSEPSGWLTAARNFSACAGEYREIDEYCEAKALAAAAACYERAGSDLPDDIRTRLSELQRDRPHWSHDLNLDDPADLSLPDIANAVNGMLRRSISTLSGNRIGVADADLSDIVEEALRLHEEYEDIRRPEVAWPIFVVALLCVCLGRADRARRIADYLDYEPDLLPVEVLAALKELRSLLE